MSSQFEPPFDKKRLASVVALSLVFLAILIAGGSLWALFKYTASSPSHVASHPLATATSDPTVWFITTATTQETTRPGNPSSIPTATPLNHSATNPTVIGDTPTTVGPTPTPAIPLIGPTKPSLLYGTNLNLQDGSDQAINGYAAPLLAQMHVGIVRIPMRPGMTQSIYLQVAQMIKSINAVPLVILETPEKYTGALNDNAQIITMMNNIFGSGVYYEYGNEPDLDSSNPATYIASWNKNMPGLQKLMKDGHLIGPSTYYADFDYLQSFLKDARPTPAFLSWHEYTCDASWDAAICIAHIENWTTHIATIRSLMNETLGSTLPIMITEWNYTPSDQVTGDSKHDNATFMRSWTTRALQVLAANQVYAAMQYSCTGTQVPLIDASNHLTVQGSTFQQMGPS